MSQASDTSSANQILAIILSELADRARAGEPLDLDVYLDAYVEEYPEHASKIRQLFPTLSAFARLEAGESITPGLAADGGEASDGSPQPRRLGDFRLVRELGRGGMGVVYEAHQVSLDRRVALKILPFAAVMDQRSIIRFKNEARAAATLHHPNIIPVYAVGNERGMHFYAMELISGVSLSRVLNQLRHRVLASEHSSSLSPLSLTDLAGIGEPTPIDRHELAGAPTVPLDGSDEPGERLSINLQIQSALSSHRGLLDRSYFMACARMIADVADALHHAHQHGILHRDIKPGNLLIDEEGKMWVADFGLARIDNDGAVTLTGDVLGTLRYMAPEQALGNRVGVDHRADVYSLGVTLYEMLTLQPAFEDSDRKTLMRQLSVDEPRRPRKWNPSIPLDLETIVLKAIAKEPRERYTTAGEIADDLRAFVEQRPIKARPATALTKLSRWTARHRPLVASAIIILIMATGGLAVSNWMIAGERDRVKELNVRAQTQRELAEQRAKELDEKNQLLQHYLFASNVKLAHQALREGDLRQFESSLYAVSGPNLTLRPDHVHWRFLERVGHPGTIQSYSIGAPQYDIAISPQHDVYAVVGLDGAVRVFHLDDHSLVVQFDAGQGEVNGAAFDPSGRVLATAGDDGNVRLWDWRQQHMLKQLDCFSRLAFQCLFADSGKTLIVAGQSPEIQIWDVETKEKRELLTGHHRALDQITLAPDGVTLASVGRDYEVRLWRLDTRRQVNELELDSAANCVTFSSDSKSVYVGTVDGEVLGWEVRSGRAVFSAEALDSVYSIAAHPDGTEIAFGDASGVVHVHSSKGPLLSRRLVFDDRVYALDFLGQQGILIGVSRDGFIRRWNRHVNPWRRRIGGNQRIESMVAIAPRLLAAATDLSQVLLIDPSTGQVVRELTEVLPYQIDLYGSTDGSVLAAIGRGGQFMLWSIPDGELLLQHAFEPNQNSGLSAAIAPDGSRFAVGTKQGIEVRDRTGALEHTLDIRGSNAIAFSPDGRSIACTLVDDVMVIDLDTGRRTGPMVGHNATIYSLIFSPDGERLVSTSGDRSVRVWRVNTGSLVNRLQGHRSAVYAARFCRDGRTLVTADQTSIAFWDVNSGQNYYFQAVPYPSQGGASELYDVAFSPNDDWMAFCGSHWETGLIVDLN